MNWKMLEDCCGEVIAGELGKLIVRQKSDSAIEIGDLLVEERNNGDLFLQVFDLMYGSQVSRSALESISGMRLEGIGSSLEFMEPHLRNYILAIAKPLLHITETPHNPKVLPNFMSQVRHIKEQDLNFLSKPKNPLYFGKVRSGSKVLNVDISLEAIDVFSHHILIPATTGRGKSNLIKIMLWNILDKEYCGVLVLDPHNEYYGKNNVRVGLQNHPNAKNSLRYYSPNSTRNPGAYTLVINLRSIAPGDFRGIAGFTEAQLEMMYQAYNHFHQNWIMNIVDESTDERENATHESGGDGTNGDVGGGGGGGMGDTGIITSRNRSTLNVLRRKFDKILGIYFSHTDNQVKFRSATFSNTMGESTIFDIMNLLDQGKKVILDTSMLEDQAELLIGSIVANQILNRYKNAKEDDTLKDKPVISIVIEEAPRVLGDQVLRTSGDNIYSDIAREGRKFKIGLVAITQLTSVIPKTILANMNTKIILGNELYVERSSIIQSASQDLSTDDRNIASLDKGEAIISSNFTKFAVPIKIPLFEDIVKDVEITSTKKQKKVNVIT